MKTWLQSTSHTGGVGLTVKCYIHAEYVPAYVAFMQSHLKQTLSEPGVIRFSFNADYKDDTIFWLVEEWDSTHSLLVHLSTDWFQNEYIVRTKPMARAQSQRALYKLGV